MENFNLWSPSFSATEPELSFYATVVHIQRIWRGTQAMISEMLDDLGVSPAGPLHWSLHHFVTNYLTDYPDSPNWRDVWMDTWKITVVPVERTELGLESYELVPTWAYDETWQGQMVFLPSECILVANFNSEETVAQAVEVLSTVSELRKGEVYTGDLLPEKATELLKSLRATYAAQQPLSQRMCVSRRPDHPLQLLVSLGIFDEGFFLDGAGIANLVSDLCYAMGGKTMWGEGNQ